MFIEELVDNDFSAIILLRDLIIKNKNLVEDSLWDKIILVAEKGSYGVEFIDNLLNITNDVALLMKKNGFELSEINNENINVEYHYCHNKINNKEIQPIFELHQDDYGGCSFPVRCCIFYHNIDLIGGNFLIYEDYENNKSKIIDIKSNDCNKTKVVIFDGSLYHSGLPVESGYRYALSFQIKKLELAEGGTKEIFKWYI